MNEEQPCSASVVFVERLVFIVEKPLCRTFSSLGGMIPSSLWRGLARRTYVDGEWRRRKGGKSTGLQKHGQPVRIVGHRPTISISLLQRRQFERHTHFAWGGNLQFVVHTLFLYVVDR